MSICPPHPDKITHLTILGYADTDTDDKKSPKALEFVSVYQDAGPGTFYSAHLIPRFQTAHKFQCFS